MIVIIGQERSGTTMLIKIIHALGVSVGNTEKWWDNIRIRDAFSATLKKDRVYDGYINARPHTVKRFIESMRYLEFHSIVWKIPQFIFYWPDLIRHLNRFNPVFIVITRNPYAIALSESKHVNITLKESMNIVYKRQQLVDEFILNNKCLVVQYEEFFVRPDDVIKKLQKYIRVKGNISDAKKEIGQIKECVWYKYIKN